MNPRLVPTLVALLALGSGAEGRQEQPAAAPLLGDRFPGGDFDPVRVARDLRALQDAPEQVFRALGDERLECTGRDPLPLSGDVEAAVVLAAEGLGRHAFQPLWEEALQLDLPPTADLRATLRLVGLVGEPRDVPALLLAVADLDPAHTLGGDATRRLERAIAELLAREPGALGSLSTGFATRPKAARLALVRAVGLSGIPSRSGWLVERLSDDAPVNLAILGELSRPGQGWVPPYALRRLQELAEDEDPALRRETARALGTVGDFDALPFLVPLLEDEAPAVRDNAHRSLRQVTGMGFGPDPARWRGWLATEQAWFEGEAPALFRRLSDRNADVVGTTLETISRHRYRRHDLAREVAPLLRDPEAAIRLRACAALQRLGSHVALEDLARALEDHEAAVREAALRALRGLTGLEVVPRTEDWLGALASAG